MWWNAQEPGWGSNFAHQADTIFATCFTFARDGKPLWLVGAAPKTGFRTYAGTRYTVTGSPYNAAPFDPGKVVGTPIGAATLQFDDGNSANFSYTVNGISQTTSITQQVFAPPGTVCR